MHLPQLRRIRWAVRAALALGVAASVAANVLHAQPNPISQAIAAWPPLALLLTVELTSRIPMYRRNLAAARVFATVAIAGIAAWVSYWHMKGVAVRYGETETSAYLLPISVDGLIVVASVCLVELAGRIRTIEEERTRAGVATRGRPVPPVPAPQPVRFVEPVPAVPSRTLDPVQVGGSSWTTDPEREAAMSAMSADSGLAPVSPAVGPAQPQPQPAAPPSTSALPSGNGQASHGDLGELAELELAQPALAGQPGATRVNGSPPRSRPPARAAVSTPTRTVVTAPTRAATDAAAPRQRRPVLETAELADAIEAMHPDISETELAKQLGISSTRLRAVRREARESRRSVVRR